jgi:anti-sigma B factor antagonist
MSDELKLDVLRAGPQAIVSSHGEIDISTAPDLREKLVELISDGVRDLVVNLEGTIYVDAAGVDVIVRIFKLVSALEGSFALVCSREHLVKVFDVSALSEALRVYPSLEAALAAADGA